MGKARVQDFRSPEEQLNADFLAFAHKVEGVTEEDLSLKCEGIGLDPFEYALRMSCTAKVPRQRAAFLNAAEKLIDDDPVHVRALIARVHQILENSPQLTSISRFSKKSAETIEALRIVTKLGSPAPDITAPLIARHFFSDEGSLALAALGEDGIWEIINLIKQGAFKSSIQYELVGNLVEGLRDEVAPEISDQELLDELLSAVIDRVLQERSDEPWYIFPPAILPFEELAIDRLIQTILRNGWSDTTPLALILGEFGGPVIPKLLERFERVTDSEKREALIHSLAITVMTGLEELRDLRKLHETLSDEEVLALFGEENKLSLLDGLNFIFDVLNQTRVADDSLRATALKAVSRLFGTLDYEVSSRGLITDIEVLPLLDEEIRAEALATLKASLPLAREPESLLELAGAVYLSERVARRRQNARRIRLIMEGLIQRLNAEMSPQPLRTRGLDPLKARTELGAFLADSSDPDAQGSLG